MKTKVRYSIYTRFIGAFIGALLFSIFLAFLIIYFTQIDNITLAIKESVESRASKVKSIINEENISPQKAASYLSTDDINITVHDSVKEIKSSFSNKEISDLRNHKIIILPNPKLKSHLLAIMYIKEKYIVIKPDIQDNPMNKFAFLQRIFLLVPLIIGSLLISLVVTIVVKPIKELSAGAKKVAMGDFDVKVNVRGNHEIADLTKNFNLMVKELSSNEYLHKDFVSNVSHEFKTPITSIKGYAKLIKSDLSTEVKPEHIDIIISESERLGNLSSNLLKLSKLENKSIINKKESFSLSEQVRRVILLLQNEWEDKNLDVDIDIDEVMYTGDQELLYQVFVNIISNAIKYSNDKGMLKVSVKKTDAVIISIEDNGIGMTSEEAEKAFLRFYKADKSRNSSGTGLGLSIAKKIIELHNGTIDVESKVNEGTKFIIKL